MATSKNAPASPQTADQSPIPQASAEVAPDAVLAHRTTPPKPPVLAGPSAMLVAERIRGLLAATITRDASSVAQALIFMEQVATRNLYAAVATYKAEALDYLRGLKAKLETNDQALPPPGA